MLPMAEKFVSIQGEGQFTGTPMFFIRLAGCTVGKGRWPFTCTAWNGLKFECDTDYITRKELLGEYSVPDLVDEVRGSGLRYVCITGGEPLIHKELDSLIHELLQDEIVPHIETSGTIFPEWDPRDPVHLTVSPKKGWRHDVLTQANEIKILVDAAVTRGELLSTFGEWADKIWLQPINKYDELDHTNVKRCLKIIEEEPRFKLSIQMHKVIGVR